jgi:hypothetical protein
VDRLGRSLDLRASTRSWRRLDDRFRPDACVGRRRVGRLHLSSGRLAARECIGDGPLVPIRQTDLAATPTLELDRDSVLFRPGRREEWVRRRAVLNTCSVTNALLLPRPHDDAEFAPLEKPSPVRPPGGAFSS